MPGDFQTAHPVAFQPTSDKSKAPAVARGGFRAEHQNTPVSPQGQANGNEQKHLVRLGEAQVGVAGGEWGTEQ
jgi:hypothetical protein